MRRIASLLVLAGLLAACGGSRSGPDRANQRDEAGQTALMRASAAGDAAKVGQLLQGGADPGLADHGGRTAYDLALAGGYGAVAETLLSQTEPVGSASWVSSKDGLRMRAAPGVDKESIGIVPFGAQVMVLRRSRVPVTIAGVMGRWCEVERVDTRGWLFDGYLTQDETKLYGSIRGDISYPSEGVPAQTVTAINLSSGQSFQTETEATPGYAHYTVSVPPGRYLVFARLKNSQMDYASFYTVSVRDGGSDHSFLTVEVGAYGDTVADVDLMDPLDLSYDLDFWAQYSRLRGAWYGEEHTQDGIVARNNLQFRESPREIESDFPPYIEGLENRLLITYVDPFLAILTFTMSGLEVDAEGRIRITAMDFRGEPEGFTIRFLDDNDPFTGIAVQASGFFAPENEMVLRRGEK